MQAKTLPAPRPAASTASDGVFPDSPPQHCGHPSLLANSSCLVCNIRESAGGSLAYVSFLKLTLDPESFYSLVSLLAGGGVAVPHLGDMNPR